jgi:ABC-type branched-subunit amino acid transport system substrate-binding protein
MGRTKEETHVIRTTMSNRFAGLFAAALLAGACSGGGASPAPATQAPATQAPAASEPAATGGGGEPAAETISVGVSGPFTGPNALTGTEIMNAVTMAFEGIDYKIGNYTVKLVPIDDQSDPAKGAAAYEQAIASQNVIAGVAGWHSSVAVAQM